MNKKIKIGQKGSIITITDKHYKAAGGEANIYVNSGMVFKLYHDPTKKNIPIKKIQELALISNPRVIVPKDIIYDASSGEPLGYTTDYIDNVEPLIKFFTKAFKQANNLDPGMIADLVKQLQLVMTDIHVAKCLVVDFNELNELVGITPQGLIPYFIDTDAYTTISFPEARAIMDSIRDRRFTTYDSKGVMHYHPDERSDWYSWAVLTFWLYTGIHPFRGNHPAYKPRDKMKQMDDGISVYHKDVKVPGCVDLHNIPKRHEDWYKEVFLKNERSVPPFADSNVPLTVPAPIITIKGNNKIDVTQVSSYSENILSVYQFMGIDYVITHKHVYAGPNKPLMNVGKAKKVLVCPASDGTMIGASLLDNKVTFTELNTGIVIGTITSKDMFTRNEIIYTVTNGKLVENYFTTLNNKVIHRIAEIENVSSLTTTIYEGFALQDLLTKLHIIVPFRKGGCFSKYLPQMDGYRVVDAKSDKNVIVIIGEKGGKFDRFIVVFNKDYSSFDVRKIDDISYDGISLCVTANGLCVLLASPTELELFVDNKHVEVLADPPFDATMRLYTTSDGIYFINNNSTHKISKK